MADYEQRAEFFMMQMERERAAAHTDLLFTGSLGYEHSPEHKHFVKSTLTLDWTAARWFALGAGLRVTTRNIYDLAVDGDFRLPLGDKRHLSLNNSYVYSIYADRNYMDFRIGLSVGYAQDYFSVSIGAMTHFTTPFVLNGSPREYHWGVTWTYCARAWVRPEASEWNVGAEVTNVRRFGTDSGREPSFVLNGRHGIRPRAGDPGFSIVWQAGCHTVAAPHSLTYEGAWALVGISCFI